MIIKSIANFRVRLTKNILIIFKLMGGRLSTQVVPLYRGHVTSHVLNHSLQLVLMG